MTSNDGLLGDEFEKRRRELELGASIVGHDLRNYLQSVLLRIDEIESQIAELSPDLKESVSAIRYDLDRMRLLLRFLGLPLEMTDEPLIPILEQIAGQVVIENPNLKINFHTKEEYLSMRVAGGYLLPMVFGNIFSNCAVHGGNRVEVTIAKHGNIAEIVISDNGPGISEDIREKLFQHGLYTQHGGLGLYLAKRILDVHNGSIEYIDQPSANGASFRICLPLRKLE